MHSLGPGRRDSGRSLRAYQGELMSTVSRRLILRAIALMALMSQIAVCSGCYHYHIRANGVAVDSTYFRKTLDSGSLKQSVFVVPPPGSVAKDNAGLPSSAGCEANGLYEVGVASNWVYSAGTVFSLGRTARVKVEWLCAKEPPVIGPRGVQPQASSPGSSSGPPGTTSSPGASGPQGSGRTVSPDAIHRFPPRQKTNQEQLTRRTVHAFFWGVLQQNLLPPAPAADSRTPANCKSMREVRLPVNYGFALITVFTAGIWSPMRVGWKCNPEPRGLLNSPAPPMFKPVSIEDAHVHR